MTTEDLIADLRALTPDDYNCRPATVARLVDRCVLALTARLDREAGYWLIERGGEWYAAAPHSSWTERQAIDPRLWQENWTRDAQKALRFARKRDAETLIAYEGWQQATATEHVDVNLQPTPQAMTRPSGADTDIAKIMIESALSEPMTPWSENRLKEALALLQPAPGGTEEGSGSVVPSLGSHQATEPTQPLSNETAWLIEDVWMDGPGTPLYIHKSFDVDRFLAEHARDLPVRRRAEKIATNDPNEAMRFTTREDAAAWLVGKPRWLTDGQYEPREHMWPASPSLVHPEEVARADHVADAGKMIPAPLLDAEFEAVREALSAATYPGEKISAAREAISRIQSRLGEVVGALREIKDFTEGALDDDPLSNVFVLARKALEARDV